ncbi:TetR/AcrR family transcriptional regulator [Anaerovorax odorimutans]|uniref:TetR/AcrR family transcriptional regulator n=1 Tax=Anaerovorax odorimutans TaxID=109327 RepID=A0ABT1RT57_9FIRM|nr:TetR/AcrR family transcriptional regulator [Anaerovorax odorimutans]MCQ4638388.1 TetR/AcrR family transcriptional regulator [Anaerovorax odorimutans]
MERQLSRRELNKKKCRARILRASRRLFSSKGYESTTIEDVADRAEVSKATLYNYFPNKESLLIGIAEEELEQVGDLISKDLKDEKNAVEKIRQALELLIVDSIRYISLARKITYLNSCEESPLYATRMDMIRLFEELVMEGQAQGTLRKDIKTSDIVDIIMGIYLMSQFEWSHIDQYTPEFCREKLNRILSEVLESRIAGDAEIAEERE